MSDQVTFEELEFDPALAAEVEDLVTSFDIEEDVDFAGHTFGIRTLSVGEEIAASKVIQGFRDTIKEAEAWTSALIGVALTHVDGDENFCPALSKNKGDLARSRFNYVSQWPWPIIEHLFRAYAQLKQQQLEKIRRVQDLSQGSLLTSWPSDDSFSTPGTSSAPTNLESPETTD